MSSLRSSTWRRWIGMRMKAAEILLICCTIFTLIGLAQSGRCVDNFQITNCTCAQFNLVHYELLCPVNKSPYSSYAVMANIQLNDQINLQCTVAKSPADLKYLSGISVGPLKRFNINFCPLPETSFNELMLSMNISKVEHLRIMPATGYGNLQKKHLEGLHDVKTLDLSSSGLTTISEDIFDDMTNLKWLHLNGNSNLTLPKGIFGRLSNLEVLDIGGLNLNHLETGTFRNLTHLRLLNLWGNRLTNLTRSIFSDVPNLESLDLHDNKIVTIRPDLFIDLGHLKTITLFNNEFSSLPQGLLYGNPRLERFLLYHNRKTLRMVPPGLLSNLTNLKQIRMENCNISSLPKDIIWGSSAVTDIQFNDNFLSELPAEIFKDNKELLSIDISNNRLTNLPDTLFSATKKLKKLNAHHNKLTYISKYLLHSLLELDEIDFSHNKLVAIHEEALFSNGRLITLDFSHNFLSFENDNDKYIDIHFGPKSPFRYCLNVKYLHLANNSIKTIFNDWVAMSNLLTLDLRYNKFTYLEADELIFYSQNEVKLDLSFNNITTVDLQKIEDIDSILFVGKSINENNQNYRKGVEINITGNPIQCDCRNYHLKKFSKGYLRKELHDIWKFEMNDMKCAGPEELEGKFFRNLSYESFVCHLKDIIPSQAASRICPDICTCTYRPDNRGTILNCTNRNIYNLPGNFLEGTLELYSRGYKNFNHTELLLENNFLTSLPKELDGGFDHVTVLSLASNNFTYFDASTLSTNMTLLELHNNSLNYIDLNSLNFFRSSKLLQVTLYDNPWECNCDERSVELLSFVQSDAEQTILRDNITCSGGMVMSKLAYSEVCASSLLAVKIVSATIALLGLIIGILIALYYRYNQEIKVWLYAHQLFLWFVTEDELDRDKLYDAFISYSHQDEDFVVKHLMPELESGTPKFKLCLHFRDWIVGDYIPNQIVKSVENSRRTVVVLSPNFLESVWGKMEFRTAHSQALTEGRARVIVILYGDIGPTENLDPELKAYVTMNTYVKWGDPWFWDKLRFALPHPPKLSSGIPLFQRNLAQQQNRPTLKIDKDDLIKGTDPNATPPAATTPPANSFISQTPSLIPNGHTKPIAVTDYNGKLKV